MGKVRRIEPISDVAAPVPLSRIEETYHSTISFQAERARHAIGRAKWSGRLAVALGTIALMEAAGIYTMMPLKEIVPVFINIHKDGVVDTSMSLSEVPHSTQQAAIEAELWQYVRHREHYSYDAASYDYAVVSGMSAPKVREEFQAAVNPKTATAPVHALGKDTTIALQRISGFFLTHSADYSAGTYQIRYTSIVRAAGHPETCERKAVTFSFEPVASLPMWQRVTFNPAGIVITGYPNPESEAPPEECNK